MLIIKSGKYISSHIHKIEKLLVHGGQLKSFKTMIFLFRPVKKADVKYWSKNRLQKSNTSCEGNESKIWMKKKKRKKTM